MWGTNSGFFIYNYQGATAANLTGGTFVQPSDPGRGNKIRIGGAGVYLTGGSGGGGILYVRNGASINPPNIGTGWTAIPTPSNVADLGVDNTAVWTVGVDGIVRYPINPTTSNPTGTGWLTLPLPTSESVSNIAVGGLGVLVNTTPANRLYYRSNVTTTNPMGDTWLAPIGDTAASGLPVMAVSNIGIYGIDSSGNLNYRTGTSTSDPIGTGWTPLDGAGRRYIALSANQVGLWAIATDDTIWVRTGFNSSTPQGTTWTQVPNGFLASISVAEPVAPRFARRRH